MTRRIPLLLTFTFSAVALFGLSVSTAHGQQKTGQIVKLIPQPKATGKAYQLRYQFQPGEKIRVKVVQLVSSENKIEGTAQRAQSRSISVKRWDITKVDAEGNITFAHVVEKANMWQKVEGRQELTYDSETDTEPPELYKNVAATIGIPLATVTIHPNGLIKERKDAVGQFNPGIGELTVILPDQPVKVSQQWYVPQRLRFKLDNGQYKHVRTRQLYTLESIKEGIASISMRTQVLSVVNDAKIEYQLVQRKQNGTIKFDLKRGRVLSKQLNMDEVVTGFQGATSRMQYLARFTEELIEQPNGRTAAKPESTKKK